MFLLFLLGKKYLKFYVFPFWKVSVFCKKSSKSSYTYHFAFYLEGKITLFLLRLRKQELPAQWLPALWRGCCYYLMPHLPWFALSKMPRGRVADQQNRVLLFSYQNTSRLWDLEKKNKKIKWGGLLRFLRLEIILPFRMGPGIPHQSSLII